MKRLISFTMAFIMLLSVTCFATSDEYQINEGYITLDDNLPATVNPTDVINVIVTDREIDLANREQWIAENGANIKYVGTTTASAGVNIYIEEPGIYNTYIKVGSDAAAAGELTYINATESETALTGLLSAIEVSAIEVKNIIDANKRGLGLFAEDLMNLAEYDYTEASSIVYTSLQGKTSLEAVETLKTIRKSVLAAELNSGNVLDIDTFTPWLMERNSEISTYYNSAYKSEILAYMTNKGLINVSELDQLFLEAVVLSVVNAATETGPVRLMLTNLATKLEIDSEKLTIDCVTAVVTNDGSFATTGDLRTFINEFVPAGTGDDAGNTRNPVKGGGGAMNVYTHPFTGSESVGTVEEVTPISMFTDLGGFAWAEEAITDLYNKGILAGRGDGKFYPNDSVKREEFVKMIMETFEIELDDYEAMPFVDVDKDEWYYGYVKSAHLAGVTNGISEDAFGIGQNISRQDLCTMIVNAINVLDGEIKGDAKVTFNDEATIADYAIEAVNKLTAAGVLSGDESRNFNPTMSATRAEAAKIIYYTMKTVSWK